MKEYKIGESFKFKNRTYIVKKSDGDSKKCSFYKSKGGCITNEDNPIFDEVPSCIASFRKDDNNVIFVEVNVKKPLERTMELAKETYPENEHGTEVREAFVEGYLKRIQDEEKEYE